MLHQKQVILLIQPCARFAAQINSLAIFARHNPLFRGDEWTYATTFVQFMSRL